MPSLRQHQLRHWRRDLLLYRWKPLPFRSHLYLPSLCLPCHWQSLDSRQQHLVKLRRTSNNHRLSVKRRASSRKSRRQPLAAARPPIGRSRLSQSRSSCRRRQSLRPPSSLHRLPSSSRRRPSHSLRKSRTKWFLTTSCSTRRSTCGRAMQWPSLLCCQTLQCRRRGVCRTQQVPPPELRCTNSSALASRQVAQQGQRDATDPSRPRPSHPTATFQPFITCYPSCRYVARLPTVVPAALVLTLPSLPRPLPPSAVSLELGMPAASSRRGLCLADVVRPPHKTGRLGQPPVCLSSAELVAF